MISTQLERLQKDSESLGSFIRQLETQGDTNRVSGFVEKKTYLDNRIAEIMGA